MDVGALKEASQRERVGKKESGRGEGQTAEGHPLKETERNEHRRQDGVQRQYRLRHQQKRVFQGGGSHQG